jgi:hypothetical protein
MQNLEQTILAQFANSPTIVQLITNFNQYIDPQADLDAFYSMVWDVDTAQGFGLDYWGKIVGVSRQLTIPGGATYLGFDEAFTAPTAASGPQPWGQAPFFSGKLDTATFTLSDDAYRTLILVKALSNISNCTARSLNQLLQNLFAGRGRCYVGDLGNMQMSFVFEFYLQPFELAIMTQSGAIPRPAAVGTYLIQAPVPNVFGFAEAGTASAAPFGQGTFFTGIQNAS